MFDLALAEDFEGRYKQFIIDTTKPLSTECMLCFQGFVGNLFVKIGRTQKQKNNFAYFIFRNTLEPEYKLLTMPIKYTISNDYKKPYYQLQIADFNKLPSEFTEFLSKESRFSDTKTDTNFSRLVAGCLYKLEGINYEGNLEQRQVHHEDNNSLNDSWCNLLPLFKKEHIKYFHYEDSNNKINNGLNISDYKKGLIKELFPERNYSKQFNNEVLFTVHYLKYLEGYQGRQFDNVKKYNSVRLPSGRTIRDYLKSSFYREFETYYCYITNNTRKLSTIAEKNLNFMINNQAQTQL